MNSPLHCLKSQDMNRMMFIELYPAWLGNQATFNPNYIKTLISSRKEIPTHFIMTAPITILRLKKMVTLENMEKATRIDLIQL